MNIADIVGLLSTDVHACASVEFTLNFDAGLVMSARLLSSSNGVKLIKLDVIPGGIATAHLSGFELPATQSVRVCSLELSALTNLQPVVPITLLLPGGVAIPISDPVPPPGTPPLVVVAHVVMFRVGVL